MFTALLGEAPLPVNHVSGVPPVAWPETPFAAGELADDKFVLEWTDYDGPSLTGTVTVNLYYTAEMPRTFPIGVIPDTLTGTAIVTGIDEADLTNRYEWDTSSVAPGSYFIWTLIDEPPEEMAVLRIIAFARGVVTVAHDQDPIAPAIVITRPDSPYYMADHDYLIKYDAFDPDGSGRVRLEVSSATVGGDFTVLADDLPAVRDGMFEWNTSTLSEGDWTIRASIVDARGMSHSSYCRFFLRVQHDWLEPDAGIPMSDAGRSDANVPQSLDSGVTSNMPAVDACGCQTPAEPATPMDFAGLIFFGLTMLALRQNRCA